MTLKVARSYLIQNLVNKWVIKVKKEMWLKSNKEFSHVIYQTGIPEGMLIAVMTLLTQLQSHKWKPVWVCELWCYFKVASNMKGCPGDDEFTVVLAGLQMECEPKLRKWSNSEARYLRDHHCNI